MSPNLRRVFIVIFILAMLGVAASVVFTPNFSRSRVQAKKKSCVANMKTIEGAMELYQMENGPVKGGFDIGTLTAKGYLKMEPKCPSQPLDRYQIFNAELPGGAPLTDVTCRIHGQLSRQETDHKTLGLDHDRRMSGGGFFWSDNIDPFGLAVLLVAALCVLWVFLEIFFFFTGPGKRDDEDAARD